MRLIDTHAHLDFSAYDTDRAELIGRLEKEEIGVINISTSLDSIEPVTELARKNRLIWGMIGLHPTDVDEQTLVQLPGLIDQWRRLLAAEPKLIGIGEIGLDYFHDRSNQSAEKQKAALRQFLTWAKEDDLPVSFHCRDAYGDLLTILKEFEGIRGVVHCFNGNASQAKEFLTLGLHLSFTAMITYPKNEALCQILAETPLDRLFLETDSPFLPPQAKRGERNDPTTVVELSELVASLKSQPAEVVAGATTHNAVTFFNLERSQ